MAGEWREVSVQEIAERTASGPFGSNIKAGEYRESGVPVIRGLNLAGPRFLDSEYVYISEEKAKELHSSQAFPGDIVLTARGSIGSVGFVPTGKFDKYVLSPNLVKLTVNRGVADPLYVFYYFRSPLGQHEILSHASTTGVPNIARALESLRKFHVILPPLPEQRAIAHILGMLDDKIELNRRMSETLEQMARAIFKAWFVDFEPVRAKMEGRWQREQSLPALPAHLYDLFPDRLVDSELGEIPEGWRVGTLGNLSFLNPEVWPKESRPSEIRYVDLSNTKWGRIEAVTTYSAADAPSRAQRVLRPGDTIVGTVRPGNGSYALISEPGLTGSTGFAVLRPREPIYTEFVYLAATAAENINALAHLADGAAYPAVRPEVVAGTTIIRPNDEVLRQFSRSTGPTLKKIAECESESRTLAALRDALLPKLVRGEIRVKDAERFLTERGL